jgi:hypothetical protein
VSGRYDFVSVWRIPADPARCWRAIEGMLRPAAGAPSPWPAVEVTGPPAALEPGAHVGLTVRSPFGYRLVLDAVLTRVEPGVVLAARSDGDLSGEGEVALFAAASGTLVRVRWVVRTERAWMNRTAWLLRPVFVLAHTAVMASGRRMMRRAVRG